MNRRWLFLFTVLALGASTAFADAGGDASNDGAFWRSVTIGAVLMALYTYGRFNNPPACRSSTTALRYYIGVSIYILVVLCVYFIVVSNQQFASWVLHHAGLGETGESSFPLLVALIMTSSVEAISPLAHIDEFLRQRFHRLASIPYRARHLSDELRTAPMIPPDGLRARVAEALFEVGLVPDEVAFGSHPSPIRVWTRLVTLMCRLREWRTSDVFDEFHKTRSGEILDLEHRYKELIPQAQVLFAALRRDQATLTSDWSPLVEAHRSAFQWQVEVLLQAVGDLVSCGILECGRTERSRDRELLAMGFEVSHTGLTTDQQLAILLMITFMLTLFMVVMGSNLAISARVANAIGASISMWLAVMWAIEPREKRWAIVQPDRPDFRPIKYYAVVALGAAASGLFVRAFSRMLQYQSFAGSLGNANQWAGWVLIDVATGIMIAVNIDNAPRRYLQWIEAAAQGIVSMGVVWLLSSTGTVVTTTPPWQLALRVGLLGALLGYFVPSWYRNVPGRDRTSPFTGEAGEPTLQKLSGGASGRAMRGAA
jgi:hypothetical protein